jgi:hypothetical protein
MSMAGGSARAKSGELRQQATNKRIEADRLDNDADAWAAGADGEERVARALKEVESPSCRVLHDRLLNPSKSRTNLDHIVVSPAGVYLVDAKNWAGEVTVYNGGLWQHRMVNGERAHLPKNDELDSVRRYAEEMSSSNACLVEPVICLASDRSAQFGEATQLRGVWVVPHGQISTWLLERPLISMPVAPATLAVQLSARYPSATEANPGPADWTVGGSRHAVGRASKSSTGRQSKKSGGQSIGKAITAVIALVLLVVLLPMVVNSIGKAVSKRIASRLIPAATWKPPCGALSTTVLAKDLGRPLYSYGAPVHEVCKWSFAPRPSASRPADLVLETGWFAQLDLGKATATGFVQGVPALRLQVPQHARVPGSLASSPGVVQPMVISLVVRKLSPAAARKAMTSMAAQLASDLPTGPGATVVKYR